jgi:hypothetical protein
MEQEKKAKTPEEYYNDYYERTIKIAEALLEVQPQPGYNTDSSYFFPFDLGLEYRFVAKDENDRWVFIRTKDEQLMFRTRYSHITLK